MTQPKHVAIILDGNRRWAKKNNLNPWKGHEKGAKRVLDIIKEALKIDIKTLTLYTFSDKNFNRSKLEVEFLMTLFRNSFKNAMEKAEVFKKGVKVRFAGKKELFPKDIQKMMLDVEEKTKDNQKMTLNFAMGYGGRLEIIEAVKKINEKKLSSDEINEELFSKELYVPENVDLLIRTSGESRLSGFLPWQSTYAELIFLDKYWPEFNEKELVKCIEAYKLRKRRFGK